MGHDRFIDLPEYPSRGEVEDALRAYISDAGTVVEDRSALADGYAFYAVRLPGDSALWVEAGCPARATLTPCERCFAVSSSPTSLSVRTVCQDAFTCAVANGFARWCALRWRGKVRR